MTPDVSLISGKHSGPFALWRSSNSEEKHYTTPVRQSVKLLVCSTKQMLVHLLSIICLSLLCKVAQILRSRKDSIDTVCTSHFL